MSSRKRENLLLRCNYELIKGSMLGVYMCMLVFPFVLRLRVCVSVWFFHYVASILIPFFFKHFYFLSRFFVFTSLSFCRFHSFALITFATLRSYHDSQKYE